MHYTEYFTLRDCCRSGHISSEGTHQAIFPGPQPTIFPGPQPTKSSVLLKTYTNEVMSVVGELQVKVQYGEQTETLKLIVISGRGPILLGRDWMQKQFLRRMVNFVFVATTR